jgi:PASTA domain-containing protein
MSGTTCAWIWRSLVGRAGSADSQKSAALALVAVVLALVAVPAPALAFEPSVSPPPGAISPGTQITMSVGADGWTFTRQLSHCSNFGVEPDSVFFSNIFWFGAVDFPGLDSGAYDAIRNPGPITLPPIQFYPGVDSVDPLYISASVALQCEIPAGSGHHGTERDGYITFGPWSMGSGSGSGSGGNPPPPAPPLPPPGGNGDGASSLPTPAGSNGKNPLKKACVVPKLRGLTVKKAIKKLKKAGCRYRVKGKGRVRSTKPKAGRRTTGVVTVEAGQPKRRNR